MYITAEGARHAGLFADEQHGGQRVEDERRGVHSHIKNYSRLRNQQKCRDYWSKVYGTEAERLSRGGVSWL